MKDHGVCKDDGSSLPCSNHGYGFAVYDSELPLPPQKTDAWYRERQNLGTCNQAGIISVCPVCHNGVNQTCDDRARWINSNWFHGPCSRFARHVDRNGEVNV